MSGKNEPPTEPFKRALAFATRSLAELPDLEVTFGGDGPRLSGKQAILPHPPRDLTLKEAARLRGMADQMALRLAHHDETAHARLLPSDPVAQGVFEAVEQARVDSIGANALGGVRQNLHAALEARIERSGFNRVADASLAPLAAPKSCATPRSSTACAPISTSSSPTCRASSALANRLQRRLMAQQNRAWEFDLEEGILDPRA
jgi:cobaltochelatase CobT